MVALRMFPYSAMSFGFYDLFRFVKHRNPAIIPRISKKEGCKANSGTLSLELYQDF